MSNPRENDRSKKSAELKFKKTVDPKQKGRSFYAAAFDYNDYSTNQQIPQSNVP
jgi:hypothetical protein